MQSDYTPCFHNFFYYQKDNNCSNCVCSQRNFCDKYCNCDPKTCTIRVKIIMFLIFI